MATEQYFNDKINNVSAFAEKLWAVTSSSEVPLSDEEFSNNDGEINRFSRPLLTFAAVMTIIIMIVGICGNLLTIVALIKCPKVRNVAAAFIISLCIADCIFCAIVLPFNAFRFIQGTWTHGDFLCRLIPFIQYGNIGVSLLCIAMITINRYIMIAHHSTYAKIYKRHWIGIMIAFCWIFSYGMQLPTFFRVWGAFGYDSKLGTCSILKDEYGRSSKTALFVIAFLIPCLIIIGCYTRIFWVVHKSETRLRKHATKQNSVPNNLRPISNSGNRISSPISSSSFNDTSGDNKRNSSASQKSMRVKDQRDVKARRNEWRITKMVLAIFLSFIMCYLPITVIKVTDKDVAMPGFHVFGYIMLYLSSCINPIIYVIMNKQYRQAYKTVLMCKPARLLPFTNTGSNANEMERHRIQLQPQSYHGVTDLYSRPAQQQQHNSTTAAASFCGAYYQQQQQSQQQRSQQSNQPSSELADGGFYKSLRQQQQQQQHPHQLHEFPFTYYQQQYDQTRELYKSSLSPVGITATINPTARYSTSSRYSHHLGGGRRDSGRGRIYRKSKTNEHQERHSR